MPTLPPLSNGKMCGVLILSMPDITWYKSTNVKSTHVQFEWTGSQEKHKLLTSKYSKITYDIRTSYKSFLKYLSTCTLKCSVNSCTNKTLASTSMKKCIMISQDNPLVKTLPLINNEEIVGTLQLCFSLQIYNDTSFYYDIQFLKKFGIKDTILNTVNDKELYNSEVFKPRKYMSPVGFSSSKSTNISKEELTSDYLMGKDMASDEEKEALNTLKIMPSAESIIIEAEKMCTYSLPSSPLHIPLHFQDNSKIMKIKSVKDMKMLPTNMKKSRAELHKKHSPKDDVYLHLSVHSIYVYHTTKSLQNYINCTYIVQCFKDQEPNKLLRFTSRHMDNNVVRYKSATLSSLLEGCTAKGITIKAYVRLLSERNPVVLGETKQMLDWTEFSTNFGVSRYIKVPIWNNDKITGHLSLSYGFYRTPIVQKDKNNFSEKHVENVIEIDDTEKELYEPANNYNSIVTVKEKTLDDYNYTNSYPLTDRFIYNRLYPESNKDIRSQLLLDELPKRKVVKNTKEKKIQTNIEVSKCNKSIQTLVKTFSIGVQVNNDELERIHDKKVNHSIIPFPEEQFKNTFISNKSSKKNSKVIDLTESYSENDPVNKTYTLSNDNDRFVRTMAENSTQTDSIVLIENQANQTNIKTRQINRVLNTFNESDIIKAKVTIVSGYNLPMVKLNGDNKPSAPTTYVIMEDFNGSYFSTSSVVHTTNPIWNSKWTVVIPKNKFIERKWPKLELWCKKYRNEYAGHDPERDMRLGIIYLHIPENDINQNCGLYDVISETDVHYGQIKILIENDNCVYHPINERTIVSTKEKYMYQKINDDLIIVENIQIENNSDIVIKNRRNAMKVGDRKDCYEYVDLTEDSPKKFDEIPLKNIAITESYREDYSSNNDNTDDLTAISSVTSWTSASDDILCSNNPRIVDKKIR